VIEEGVWEALRPIKYQYLVRRSINTAMYFLSGSQAPLPCGRGSVGGLILRRDREGAVLLETVSVFLK